MRKKREKIIPPPQLPPDVPEEEIEVSDEDVQFVNENLDYAGFVSTLDTRSIDRHVTRIAKPKKDDDQKKDDVESLYERRLEKKSLHNEKQDDVLEVDPVDALPVKTLDGELYYRRVPKASKTPEGVTDGEPTCEDDKGGITISTVKLSKAEKRAKLKMMRKEAKKQMKEMAKAEEVEQPAHAEVLDELMKDLTEEEANKNKRTRLAELGTALITDPEANIKSLKEMLEMAKDRDPAIVILGLKSLLLVFRDIIPGYRIRLPTEKEQEMKVTKAIKKMRFYESSLLSAYKAYVQKLIALEKQDTYKRVAARCICTLVEGVPHFNFRQNLLAAVVKNMSSPDNVIRQICCATVKSLFTNEGKHGGEATVEAVNMIADLVKAQNCQLHPQCIEVLLSLSFDEDLGKLDSLDADNRKSRKGKGRKNMEEPRQLPDDKRKKSKQELILKTREEVSAELKAASLAKDVTEQRRLQSETLASVFQIFFRVLKHSMLLISEDSFDEGAAGSHPLLAPCLDGIGKFSHLIDMDFIVDLMNYLRKLAEGGSALNGSSEKRLTVSERLQCCIVAFKVMRNNLDALNVDLRDFFVQLYNLILEYRPGRDDGTVLAEALKIMLCDDRQHDMQRAAAFIKRLATFSLSFGSAESAAALVTLRHLLLKNVKCRNLLENDAGGGSVSGGIAKYQPYASDPNLSGALASVLWELNLLAKHYHPAVSAMASGITTLSSGATQGYPSNVSPQQVFTQLSREFESLAQRTETRVNGKRKRENTSCLPATLGIIAQCNDQITEDEVRKKLSDHFLVVRDIAENERLRFELDRTNVSINLYKQYKKQKKHNAS